MSQESVEIWTAQALLQPGRFLRPRLLSALRAERVKLRHTLALWMVLLTPLAIAILLVLELITIGGHRTATHAVPDAATAWLSLGKALFGLWGLLMLPLFITLEAALLAALEHGHQQWKYLLALPISPAAHYVAKGLVLIAMVIAAQFILLLLTPLAGWLLMLVDPGSGLRGLPQLSGLLWPVLGSTAAAMLIVALQTFISLRWRSFTLAVSVGIVGTVAGFIIGQSRHYGKFFPWSMPVQAFGGHGENMPFVATAGLGLGLLVAVAGLWSLLRRDCP